VTITKNKHLYEVLFRFNESGQAQGAHAQYREIVKEGDVVLADRIGDAVPVSLLDAPDKLTVAQVIGDAMAGVVALKDEKVAMCDELTAQVAALEADLAAQVSALQAELAAKDANIQELIAQVGNLEIRVVELMPPVNLADYSEPEAPTE